MATLKEILSLESPASGGIRLWPEGIFYKAYDCSAYLFVHELRAYRPKRKFFKVVERHVVSIGFPMSALPAILRERHAEAADSDMGTKYIALGKPVEERPFREWAETIAPEEEAERTKTRNGAARIVPAPCGCNGEEAPAHVSAAERRVLESLRAFSLENASPMQCMMLVAELRRRLQPDAADGGDGTAGQPGVGGQRDERRP